MKTLPKHFSLVFLAIMALTSVGCQTICPEKNDTCSFEKDKFGTVPDGWTIAETNGKGKTATWQIIPYKGLSKKAVAITSSKNVDHTFNLLIAKKNNLKDIKIELKVKAISGKQDQGGGPIWRALDANNYYIARWNPLEDNLRFYYVKDGKRVQLASADVNADPQQWHEIEVEHVGDKITVEFDGRNMIEITDTTFTESGMVGLWTKADAATAFDNFEIEQANGK